MAYPHYKYEVTLLGTGATRNEELSLTVSGNSAKWGPGFMPHIVRAVSIQVASATGAASAAGSVSFRNETDYGDATTASGDQFARVTLTTGASNKVYYVDNLNTEIGVGSKISAVVVALSSGERVVCRAWVEPRHETPANQTKMATG